MASARLSSTVFRFSIVFVALTFSSFCPAQTTASVDAGSKELRSIFHDYREDQLKSNPEYASSVGDRRYNDQLSDLSARAVNERLERERGFLARLGAIDRTGLNDQERSEADKLENTLIDDEASASKKTWETPLDPANGVQKTLANLPNHIPLQTVKDYDDYIERLKKVPDQFRQVIANMQLGIDEGRVQSASVVEVVMAQVNSIAGQKPEESPFAAPLKRFPATITPATRQRVADDMLAAIQDDVLPAYARFGRFLKAQVLPAAERKAGK